MTQDNDGQASLELRNDFRENLIKLVVVIACVVVAVISAFVKRCTYQDNNSKQQQVRADPPHFRSESF